MITNKNSNLRWHNYNSNFKIDKINFFLNRNFLKYTRLLKKNNRGCGCQISMRLTEVAVVVIRSITNIASSLDDLLLSNYMDPLQCVIRNENSFLLNPNTVYECSTLIKIRKNTKKISIKFLLICLLKITPTLFVQWVK